MFNIKRKKGSAILITLMVIMVLGVLSSIVMFYAMNESKITEYELTNEKLMQALDAGFSLFQNRAVYANYTVEGNEFLDKAYQTGTYVINEIIDGIQVYATIDEADQEQTYDVTFTAKAPNNQTAHAMITVDEFTSRYMWASFRRDGGSNIGCTQYDGKVYAKGTISFTCPTAGITKMYDDTFTMSGFSGDQNWRVSFFGKKEILSTEPEWVDEDEVRELGQKAYSNYTWNSSVNTFKIDGKYIEVNGTRLPIPDNKIVYVKNNIYKIWGHLNDKLQIVVGGYYIMADDIVYIDDNGEKAWIQSGNWSNTENYQVNGSYKGNAVLGITSVGSMQGQESNLSVPSDGYSWQNDGNIENHYALLSVDSGWDHIGGRTPIPGGSWQNYNNKNNPYPHHLRWVGCQLSGGGYGARYSSGYAGYQGSGRYVFDRRYVNGTPPPHGLVYPIPKFRNWRLINK